MGTRHPRVRGAVLPGDRRGLEAGADGDTDSDSESNTGPARHRDPIVIAHRGSSHAVPEHTLAAYKQAIKEGADALECDVRLTRDGHLVCVHDRKVDRTSNGRGVVSMLELSELHELNFGLPGHRTGPVTESGVEIDEDRCRVLTFARLLELALDADRRVEVHVETKHPTRYAGLVEQKLIEVLREHGVADPPTPGASLVTVMSFSSVGLRRVRLLAGNLPTVFLMQKRLPQLRRDGLLPYAVRTAGPGVELIREFPDYVARAHTRGHRVHVWTVDEADDLELMLQLGVDGIITNRPAQALQRLGRLEPK